MAIVRHRRGSDDSNQDVGEVVVVEGEVEVKAGEELIRPLEVTVKYLGRDE